VTDNAFFHSISTTYFEPKNKDESHSILPTLGSQRGTGFGALSLSSFGSFRRSGLKRHLGSSSSLQPLKHPPEDIKGIVASSVVHCDGATIRDTVMNRLFALLSRTNISTEKTELFEHPPENMHFLEVDEHTTYFHATHVVATTISSEEGGSERHFGSQLFEYSLLLTYSPVDEIIVFRSISDEELISDAPARYFTTLGFKRFEAKQDNDGNPPLAVDFGGKLSIKPADFGCCRVDFDVTVNNNNDGPDGIGAQYVREVYDYFVNIVPNLHNMYKSYAKVDTLMFEEFERTLERSDGESLDRHESFLIVQAMALVDKEWKRVAGTVRKKLSYFTSATNSDDAFDKVSGQIDCSAKRLLSWLWTFMSNERIQMHIASNGLAYRTTYSVPSLSGNDIPRSKISICVKKSNDTPASSRMQYYQVSSLWKTYTRLPDGTCVIGFCSTSEYLESLNSLLEDMRLQKYNNEMKAEEEIEVLRSKLQHLRKNSVSVRDESDLPKHVVEAQLILNDAVGVAQLDLDNAVRCAKSRAEDESIAIEEVEASLNEVRLHIAAANNPIGYDPIASAAKPVNMRGVYMITPVAQNVCQLTMITNDASSSSFHLFSKAARSSFKLAEYIHYKYERNGRLVDRERREVFPAPPSYEDLSVDQKELIDSSHDMLSLSPSNEARESTWKLSASSSPLVNSRYKISKKGMITRSTTTVYCPALLALAWAFDFCGRVRQKLSDEVYFDRARVLVKEYAPNNDIVVALITRSPVLLSNREFVFRAICTSDPFSSFSLTTRSVDETVDYGFSGKGLYVRGYTATSMRFVKLNDMQCRVELTSLVLPGGHLPGLSNFFANSANSHAVETIRAEFESREEEREEISRLSSVIVNNAQEYSDDELEHVKNVVVNLGGKAGWFSEAASFDSFVSMGFIDNPEEKTIEGRSSTNVYASIGDIAAWDSLRLSRDHVGLANKLTQTKEFRVKHVELERSLSHENEHSNILRVVRHFSVAGFKSREWVVRRIWKWIDCDTLVVAEQSVDCDAFARNDHYVRVECMALLKLERLPNVDGSPSTRVTYTVETDRRGLAGRCVPRHFNRRRLAAEIAYLSHMRTHFKGGVVLQSATRQKALLEMLEGSPSDYSETEEGAILEGGAIFNAMQGNRGREIFKKHQLVSPVTSSKISYEKGQRFVLGWASTNVRGSAKQVMAYLLDRTGALEESHEIEKNIDEVSNEHNCLVYSRSKVGNDNMDSVSRVIWRRVQGGNYIYVVMPTDSAKRAGELKRNRRVRRMSFMAREVNFRRVKCKSAMKLVKNGPTDTTVEFMVEIEAGDDPLPESTLLRLLDMKLELVSGIQEHFLERRALEDYVPADGKAVGKRLMNPGGEFNEVPWKVVEELVDQHNGLKSLSSEFPWLAPFLRELVKGDLHLSRPVLTKVDCLSIIEAVKIAKSLTSALRQRKTVQAGLYQWKNQNRSMMELFERYPWTEDMLMSISRDIMKLAPWGLMWRVCTGAGLSIVDTATDVFVIVGYMGSEETKVYAYFLIGMVAASLFLHILLAVLQNWRLPKALAREIVMILLFLKPAVDARRVVLQISRKHQIIDAKYELFAGKCAEMVCESIPGCLLQMYVVIASFDAGRKVTTSAIVSILVSALTTGCASATISYDFDTDPVRRMEAPNFYGYIPDEGQTRTVLYIIMAANSSLLLLVRCFSAAMMLFANKFYLMYYVAGDMLFFLIYKSARNDLRYWMPVYGVAGAVSSLLSRIVVKLIADFTGVIHFRHPYELGGAYWTFDMFFAITTSFLSVYLFFVVSRRANSIAPTEMRDQMDQGLQMNDAVTLISILCGLLIFSFVCFLALMKKEYRSTFFSLLSGPAFTREVFNQSSSDAKKAFIVDINKHYWIAIAPVVKSWICDNWYIWKEEKPDWFTARFVDSIPIGMVPNELEEELDSVSNRFTWHNSSAKVASMKSRFANQRSRRSTAGKGGRTQSLVRNLLQDMGYKKMPARAAKSRSFKERSVGGRSGRYAVGNDSDSESEERDPCMGDIIEL
jgi:hypothetical protein